MSGPESPPELQRSWYVEGHIRFGVISSVLMQRYLRTIRQRSLARGFSDRFSLESSGTSDTHRQTRSASKSQRTPSKNKEPAHLRRSRRLEDRSITKKKARREKSKSRGKRSGYQETSSDSEHEEGSEDTYEDLNSPYKRPKPTPFTQRITRFRYHRRAKLPRNIRVYEGNKDPEDHLGGAAQNWFDDLDPKSVDSFEELSQKFLRDTFTPLTKTSKEILAMESISFIESPPLIRTPEKQNLNKFCDYRVDRGHNTNDCYQLKKQIEEVVASGKLTHLVKDIRRNNQRNGGQGRSNIKVINMIRGGRSWKRPFEGERSGSERRNYFSHQSLRVI
ncbi:hypothetical protein Tco_0981688 [Tanacetum coccineum]